MSRYRLLVVNVVLLAALLAGRSGRAIEDADVAKTDFLQRIDLGFRGWKTEDQPLDAADRELLDPDAALIRRFQSSPTDYVELAIIAGHRKKTIHTPGFCLAGDGWQMLSEKECELNVGGRKI